MATIVLFGLFITSNLHKQLGSEPAELALLAKNFADGNLKQKILLDESNSESVTHSIKTLLCALNDLVKSLNHMILHHDEGNTDVTVNERQFKGGFAEMVAGINKMMSGHILRDQKAMHVVQAFGEARLNEPLELFPGKQVYISETIEQVRSNIQNLITDANMLANSAIAGNLSTRDDASKHFGDFRKLLKA